MNVVRNCSVSMKIQADEKVKDRKMKLTMLRNSRNGIEEIGIRAVGVYRGRRIERSSWILAPENSELSGENMEFLKDMVMATYRAEMKAIDRMFNDN